MRSELDEAERRIFEHPAFLRHEKYQAFKMSLDYVFTWNGRELVGLLDEASTNEELAVELIQNVYDDAVRRSFQASLTQRLHNFVSSYYSLASHSRALADDLPVGQVEAYEAMKARLVREDVKFLWDLRRYAQHWRLPLAGHAMRWSGDGSFQSQVMLSVPSLRRFDAWTEPAKRFMATHEDGIELRPLVRGVGDLVYEVNAWLLGAVLDANEAGLEELERLTVERNAILLGVSFDEAKARTERHTAQRSRPPPQSE